MGAVPVSSTTWFPRQWWDGGCSLQLALPFLSLKQWQWLWQTDAKRSVLTALYCPFFSRPLTLLIQIHVPLTLQTAPSCSKWLNSAAMGSAQLELGFLLFHSLEILPTPALLFSTVCWSCISVGCGGDGEPQRLWFAGLILAIPPPDEEREAKLCTSKGIFLFLPPKTTLPQWWCSMEQLSGHTHIRPKDDTACTDLLIEKNTI